MPCLCRSRKCSSRENDDTRSSSPYGPPLLPRGIKAPSSVRVLQAHSSSNSLHLHTSCSTPSTMSKVIISGIYSITVKPGGSFQAADYNAQGQGSVLPISHSLHGIHVCLSPAVGEPVRSTPRQDVRVGAVYFGLYPIKSPLHSGSSRISAGTFAPSRTS